MARTSSGAGLVKGARITGPDRQALGAQLAERYRAGESIRSLAQDTGRSFGFVHGVIKESGVPLRGRGGATRRGTPAAAAAPGTSEAAAVTAEDAGAAPKAGKAKKAVAKKGEGKKGAPEKEKAEGKKSAPKREKGAGKKKGRS